MATNFIDRKSLPWMLFQTPETHQSSESLNPQDPGKPPKALISSSTTITPRRSPRLAQIEETSPHILQVKRKWSKEGKTPRAKRRLSTDGPQSETTFGSIINRLENHLTSSRDIFFELGMSFLLFERRIQQKNRLHSGQETWLVIRFFWLSLHKTTVCISLFSRHDMDWPLPHNPLE